MNDSVYLCKYCGSKMNKVEFEMYGGFCLKCRDVHDWKQILKEHKK